MSGHTFIKTFDRYDSDSAAPQTGAPAASGVWAMRITRFDPGSKLGFTEDNLHAVYVLAHYRRRPGKGIEPFEVYVSGNIAFEYVTSSTDFDIFDGSLSPDNGYDITSVNEVDSGPVAVAAGAASAQIIGPNPGRVRGVTVQNVGVTAVAVSKDPGLLQNLAKADAILNADTAANAGNGGVANFDGWRGPIYAVNVAGGPGSLLVSAF